MCAVLKGQRRASSAAKWQRPEKQSMITRVGDNVETMNVACPHCGGHVLDDGNYSGQVVACPFCAQQFQMLAAEERAKLLDMDERSMPPAVPGPRRDVGGASGRPLAKPWQVTAIGAMRIGSGALNVLWGMGLFIFVVPLLLIPLGVAEIVSGANLLSARPKPPPNTHTLAILEIASLLMCGFIQCVIGILSLVWLSDNKVAAYLSALDSRP
jgi:hypothetical protein